MERVYTTKNYTFWTAQRLKKGVTIPTIAKALELPEGAVRTYFSGRHIPRDYALMKICDYFDIPLEEGREASVKDHEIWKQRHSAEWHTHDKDRESAYHKQYTTNDAYMLCITFRYKEDFDLVKKMQSIELGSRGSYVKWVLRQHLGNDMFSTERFTPEVSNLLKIIYSEVPFEIFMQMLSSLVDTKTIDARLLYGYVSYHTFMEIYKLQDKI